MSMLSNLFRLLHPLLWRTAGRWETSRTQGGRGAKGGGREGRKQNFQGNRNQKKLRKIFTKSGNHFGRGRKQEEKVQETSGERFRAILTSGEYSLNYAHCSLVQRKETYQAWHHKKWPMIILLLKRGLTNLQLLTFNPSISWTFLASNSWYSSLGWMRLSVCTTESSLRSKGKHEKIVFLIIFPTKRNSYRLQEKDQL